MQQLQIWQFILERLQQKTPVMLLYVVTSTGSSPGRQGFFMAVDANGEMHGSIGGGIMEHKFVEKAKNLLKKEETASQLQQQIHRKSANRNQSGMICSGEQTILLYHVDANDSDVVHSLIQCLLQQRNGVLTVTPPKISFANSDVPALQEFFYADEANWSFRVPIGFSDYLYIIGGGHCALALSQQMRMLNFHITVVEERNHLHTFESNSFAQQRIQVENYQEIGSLVTTGHWNSYVVIMTSGYRTDEIALKQILGRQLRYLGVLGSKSKMEVMFNKLLSMGVSSNLLSTIHAPIGIPIQSHTPQEIAVSIAAQIISIRNQTADR